MKTTDRLALEENNKTLQREIDALQRALTSREETEITKVAAARLLEVPVSIRMDVKHMLVSATQQINKIHPYLSERFE